MPDARAEAQDLERRNALTRDAIDPLISRGVLRRGLTLICSTCAQAAFIALDYLGQANVCPRCAGKTDLTRDAWKMPADEPTWFYDLHPVARTLYTSHGHAPLQLAAYLQKRSRRFSDVAELELFHQGQRKAIAETDLLAHADGLILTGEVKTNDHINDSGQSLPKAAGKRVDWAAAVRADEVLLATTQAAWQQSSVDAVAKAIANAASAGRFPPHRTPRLRVITGLGTPIVADRTQR